MKEGKPSPYTPNQCSRCGSYKVAVDEPDADGEATSGARCAKCGYIFVEEEYAAYVAIHPTLDPDFKAPTYEETAKAEAEDEADEAEMVEESPSLVPDEADKDAEEDEDSDE